MSNKSVLVVDDDEISLLILQNALEMEGYSVIATSDSLLATTLFNQYQPDAVILDIFMPDKDGFELLKEIRQLHSKTFIVAISASQQYLRAMQLLGADVALAKTNISMPDAIVDCIKMSC
jgi:CheY-like chemotaxis protein